MAYDAQAAHEYYVKYRKKGIKKGRKKGSAKTKSSRKTKKATVKKVNLVGISNSGLNDEGKMQYALLKEKLKDEMNAAMQAASTPEEKERIRMEFQKRALDEVNKLKSDSQYAVKKAAKKENLVGIGTSGLNEAGRVQAAMIKDSVKKEMNEALAGATSEEEKQQIRREFHEKALTEMSKLRSDSQYAKPKAEKRAKTTSTKSAETKAATEAIQKSVETLTALTVGLAEKVATLTEEKKTEAKQIITDILTELKKQLGSGADDLEKMINDQLGDIEKE